MAPPRSLSDFVATLTTDRVLAAARRLEDRRGVAASSPGLDTVPGQDALTHAVTAWHGFELPGLWTTPYMLKAGLAAADAGIVAFDRLERAFLPPHASWVHPEIGPAGYAVSIAPERVVAPALWPFAQDLPVADFQSTGLPPKWLSHSLVHTLVGFGWWPTLTEWDLMHMARLSEALASYHWYWLAELGRLDHRGLGIDLSVLGRNDAPVYGILEEGARVRETRLERLEAETSRIVSDNGLDVLGYELYAYVQGVYQGDLVEPTDHYLGFGEAAEYAKTHLLRLRSPAFQRYLEHCLRPGRDYATDTQGFEAQAARALAAVFAAGDEAGRSDAPQVGDTAAIARRARRALADVGWRICHAAALLEPADGFQPALTAVADAIAKIEDTTVGADDHAAVALESVRAALATHSAPSAITAAVPHLGSGTLADVVLAIGYAPLHDPRREPPGVREARARAVVRRGWALHGAVGAALEGLMPVVRRAVERARGPGLIDTLAPLGEEAARADEIPWLGYAYLGWLQVAVSQWTSNDPDLPGRRWHYRLARRFVPADPATFGDYEVAWNPYLKRFPLPFDAKWNDELRKSVPGAVKPFKGKNTTSVWYCYLGPGRERPVYLPLAPRLNALIFKLKNPKRLDQLVADPDFGLEFMRQAVADEAVLLFHKPAMARPERAVDIFEVAMEAAAGLDQQVEPFGAWDDQRQADAYEAFCASSDHYQASSRALCDAVGIPPQARVAELGFGTGVTTAEILGRLGPEGRLYGVDAAPLMLERIIPRINDGRASFQQGGARALAWVAAFEGGFDRVVANASIWLTPSIADAAGILARATVAGGRIGLSFPA
ncbi:MAG: class I SAM-dependent methyltransferase, partial [Deltaproteobacteria bacterium]|nr:class I SAM-dependent methyltransferase [Deltaproteobacteria bacterium]